jgi:hypothetical protein
MSDLVGQNAEIRFTVQVKRADTGKIEEFEMVGKIQPQEEEENHGSNTQHSSTQRSH